MVKQTLLSPYIRFEKKRTDENFKNLLKNFDKIIESQKIYEKLGLKVIQEIKNPSQIVKKIWEKGFNIERNDYPCLHPSTLPSGFILPVLSTCKIYKTKKNEWIEVLNLNFNQQIKKNDVNGFSLFFDNLQKMTNLKINDTMGFGEKMYKEIEMKEGKYNIFLYSGSLFVFPEETNTSEKMTFKISNKEIEINDTLYIFNSSFLQKNKSDKYLSAGNKIPEYFAELLWDENFINGKDIKENSELEPLEINDKMIENIDKLGLENENIGYCRKINDAGTFRIATGKNIIGFISPTFFEKINFFNML